MADESGNKSVNINTPLGSVSVGGDNGVKVDSVLGSVTVGNGGVSVKGPFGSVTVGSDGVNINKVESPQSPQQIQRGQTDYNTGRAETRYSSTYKKAPAKHPDAGGDGYREPRYQEPAYREPKYEAPPVYKNQNPPAPVNPAPPAQPVDGREYKCVRSPWPFLAVGGFWLAYALLFPLYSPWHVILCAALSVGVYNIAKKKFPDRWKEIIKPYQAPKSEDPEVSQTIGEAVKTLDSISESSRKISPKCPSLASNADSLVNQARQIIDYIAENTQKAPLVRRTFNYYIPTLDKLLKSWLFFDEHGEGDSMFAGKSEIEQSVAEMDNVLRGQHEKLVNDAALDISAEINVLEKLLRDSMKEEGLKAESKPSGEQK